MCQKQYINIFNSLLVYNYKSLLSINSVDIMIFFVYRLSKSMISYIKHNSTKHFSYIFY